MKKINSEQGSEKLGIRNEVLGIRLTRKPNLTLTS